MKKRTTKPKKELLVIELGRASANKFFRSLSFRTAHAWTTEKMNEKLAHVSVEGPFDDDFRVKLQVVEAGVQHSTDTKPFQREDRYHVLKRKDVNQALTPTEREILGVLEDKVANHRLKHRKAHLSCVVVESDWPEFDPTWDAIKARMTGIAMPDAQLRKLTEKMVLAIVARARAKGKLR